MLKGIYDCLFCPLHGNPLMLELARTNTTNFNFRHDAGKRATAMKPGNQITSESHKNSTRSFQNENSNSDGQQQRYLPKQKKTGNNRSGRHSPGTMSTMNRFPSALPVTPAPMPLGWGSARERKGRSETPMANYTIFTDAAADLPLEWYVQYGIPGAHTGPDMLSVCFWGKRR